MSITAMPVATATTKLARVQALLNWRDWLTDIGYGIMSPQDVLEEIRTYKTFARSLELPECLIELQKVAEEKLEVNETKGKGTEVFAPAGVLWIIDREVTRLLALTS